MKSNVARICRSVETGAVLLLIIIACMSSACAQTPTSTPKPLPTPSVERRFFKNILRDQRAIWTSPLHLEGDDAKWLVPLGLSTAALITTDRRTAGALHNDRLRLNISRDVAYLGSAGGASSIAGAFYLIGRATHNARARETGLLGGEALIDGGIVAFVIKHATQRRRPRAPDPGDFFEGGLSFPSGHTTAAWSLATVVANEYRHNRLVQVSAYGLAAAASMARFTGRNPFLSDVLFVSPFGYRTVRYLYRTPPDPTLSNHPTQRPPARQSKLLPLIAPQYDRRARCYGVTLHLDF